MLYLRNGARYIGGKLALITNKKSMSFRLVPKSVTMNDLETAKWSLFCVILLNFVVSSAHCVEVVDKAITVHTYGTAVFFQTVINRWNQLDQRVVGASRINVFKEWLNKIRETRMGFFMD